MTRRNNDFLYYDWEDLGEMYPQSLTRKVIMITSRFDFLWQGFGLYKLNITVMKRLRNLLVSLFIFTGLIFFLSGCYEPHYYHSYNHHSRGWYERRHTPPPAGINFEVDVYHRRHYHRH
jgi:hypothetical protein